MYALVSVITISEILVRVIPYGVSTAPVRKPDAKVVTSGDACGDEGRSVSHVEHGNVVGDRRCSADRNEASSEKEPA